MTRALLLIAATALAGCSGNAVAAPGAPFIRAKLVADAPSAPAAATPPLPAQQPSRRTRHRRPRPSAGEHAEGSSEELKTGSEAGALQVYAWAEGSLYRLDTAPEQVSDIALQPGESLISVAAGDTARWVIGNTASGAGGARRVHVLVKPSAAGLRTNLVIATDRRVYHVELQSRPGAAMAGISWSYPDDGLLALQVADQPPVAPEIAIEALNFDYRIEGDDPPWRPLRVFDDGRQVYIEFPATLGQGEAPPLFVTGDHGRTELVNYRQRGRYYIVDRLFGAAELRLGEKRQQVVRIVRKGPARARRAS